MVGAEHVDRPVEAALELVREVDDVGGAVRRRPALLGRADQHAVVVVAVGGRARPDGAVLLVRVERAAGTPAAAARARSAAPTSRSGCGSARGSPRSARASCGTGSLVGGGELGDVLAPVAVLGRLLPAPDRLDRGAEALHLRAGVVVVVLARDLVARELELARDRVADRAVARRGDRDRPGRVGRDHLDLDLLRRLGRAAAVAGPAARISPSASPNQAGRQPEVDEARAGDLGALDLVQPGRGGRELLAELARRAALHRRELHRDVGRVVAVRGVVRPLELDRRARELRQPGLEAGDGVRQGLRSGANSSSRRRSSSGVPAAIITSPTSSTASGSGVVSKVPSPLRSATIIAPVCCADAQVADRLAGLAARLA